MSFSVVSSTPGSVPTSVDATYSCVFRNLWTEARHPAEFPVNSAHWSPTVIGSHGPGYTMWRPGELATTGVERVAEVCPISSSRTFAFTACCLSSNNLTNRSVFGRQQTDWFYDHVVVGVHCCVAGYKRSTDW